LPLEDEDGSTEKGPTELLPGSHKWTSPDERLRSIIENTNDEVDEDEEESDTGDASVSSDDDDDDDDIISDDKSIIAPVLKQGDALIYDYRVCHRGTANLFGKLEAATNNSAATNTDADTIPARTKHGKKKKARKDSENDVGGTRRILYLMYARPWFTDHVNFDYTKNAKSLWDDHTSAEKK
jgi:ectoine hydroxylase-related dioxygenase (phytanoyl-CoA dioxygenase family)